LIDGIALALCAIAKRAFGAVKRGLILAAQYERVPVLRQPRGDRLPERASRARYKRGFLVFHSFSSRISADGRA